MDLFHVIEMNGRRRNAPVAARQARIPEPMTPQQLEKIKNCMKLGPAIFGVIFVVALFMTTIHRVDEGHIAVYYRGGALLEETAGPGIHLKIPFITSVRQILVLLQTDKVKDVPCGTAGGVIISFKRIEVVNIISKDSVHDIVRNYTVEYDKPLIYNKIHHEINKFCSKHTIQEVYIDLFDKIGENLRRALQADLDKMAPGLKVLTVRVTKPKIPHSILENYEKMEVEKTQLLVVQQNQLVVEKNAETELKKAIIGAERKRQVAEIKQKQRIARKEMEKTVSRIQNEIHLDKQKAYSDANFYELKRKADAYKKLLTKKYLESRRIAAIHKNNKIFYGDSIPKALQISQN